MSTDNKVNLTFSDFISFKPMAFAKTAKVKERIVLESLQVAVPVPNRSFCIVGEPELKVRRPKRRIILKIKIDGRGDDRKAGQMLYFSLVPTEELIDIDQRDFDLVVKVYSEKDRPQLGKSMVKIIDEEEE